MKTPHGGLIVLRSTSDQSHNRLRIVLPPGVQSLSLLHLQREAMHKKFSNHQLDDLASFTVDFKETI